MKEGPPLVVIAIVDEEPFRTTYFKGEHPEFGTPINGITGPETVSIKPKAFTSFEVIENGKS